jgi:hypothetical protein
VNIKYYKIDTEENSSHSPCIFRRENGTVTDVWVFWRDSRYQHLTNLNGDCKFTGDPVEIPTDEAEAIVFTEFL